MFRLVLTVYLVQVVYTSAKPYDHEAMATPYQAEDRVGGNLLATPSAPPSQLDECIDALKKLVESGNKDRPLHRKLYVKMMARYLRDGTHYSESYYGWSLPEVYDRKGHYVKKVTFKLKRGVFVEDVGYTYLNEHQAYVNGAVVFRDPYDNTEGYPDELLRFTVRPGQYWLVYRVAWATSVTLESGRSPRSPSSTVSIVVVLL